MEPKVTARHIKTLIFARLNGQIAEMQQKKGLAIPSPQKKAYNVFNVPRSNLGLHTSHT